MAVRVPSGESGCEDVKIIGVERRYSPRQPAAHIVGYTNSDGGGVCGIEKSFESIFKNNRRSISAVFPVDAYGRVISGADITARTDGGYGESGVYLTLNLEIQQIVEDCMDECGVDIGAVVILDPKNGAIRACASRRCSIQTTRQRAFRTAILRLSTALFALCGRLRVQTCRRRCRARTGDISVNKI